MWHKIKNISYPNSIDGGYKFYGDFFFNVSSVSLIANFFGLHFCVKILISYLFYYII